MLSGGDTRKGKSKTEKVITSRKLVDKQSGKRKTAMAAVTQEHITAVMGHNLLSQRLLPITVVSQISDFSEKQKKELDAVIYTSHELGPVGDVAYSDKVYTHSKKGSITMENIADVMLRAFKSMFPNLKNEDGRRVLWLTDFHNSRFSLELLELLEKNGITLGIYLYLYFNFKLMIRT